MGEKDSNNENSTCKSPGMRKRFTEEKRNVGQCGWIRDGGREMGEGSSRWNSDDEGLSRS